MAEKNTNPFSEFLKQTTTNIRYTKDDSALQFVQLACAIVGFPLLEEGADSPESSDGSFQFVYSAAGHDPTIEICFDGARCEVLMRARIGHVALPSCQQLLLLAAKAQSVLLNSDYWLFVHPGDESMYLQKRCFSLDGLDLIPFAAEIVQLTDIALAWRQEMDSPVATTKKSAVMEHGQVAWLMRRG